VQLRRFKNFILSITLGIGIFYAYKVLWGNYLTYRKSNDLKNLNFAEISIGALVVILFV